MHYDKIVCFQFGNFYETFFEDAIICHKHLDLNWMGAVKKLKIGFPEVSLTKNTKKLVDLGFKVCIVDQIQDADSDLDEEEGKEDESQLEARIPGTKRMNDVNMMMGKGKGPVFKGRKIA